MQDSKLITVFSKFSGYDLANLRKFVYSPYFNKRETVCLLFDFLNKERLKKKPNYDRYAAWDFCMDKTIPFDGAVWGNTMNVLLQLLEQFISTEHFWKAPNLEAYKYLSQHYHQWDLPQFAQQTINRWQKLLSGAVYQNSGFWEQCYEYEQVNYVLQEREHRKTDANLQRCAQTLDIYFISEKLKQACELLAQQHIRQTQYEWGLLPMVLSYVAANIQSLLTHPSIALYYYYYQAVTESDEHFFELYTQQLLAIQQEFPAAELRNLYRMAINYAIRRANQTAQHTHVHQAWALYVAALERRTLLQENQELSRFAYKNIVSLGIRAGEQIWVSHFIDNYTTLLASPYQYIYKQYALGKLCFANTNYAQALTHLQEVAYEDIFLNLDARVMQLKIYYELDEYDVLESFLQSFKMFLIRKKKKLSYHYDNYKNIIQLTQKLMNLQAYDKKKTNRVRQKIKTIPTLTEREWLLAQLDKL